MFQENINQYIRSVRFKMPNELRNEYPFCLEAIQELTELNFKKNVSFIIGENGTGKSTLLEAIAVAYGFNPEGGSKNFNFKTNNTHSILSNYIKLIKGINWPSDGYFLRAESFYNVATNIEELDSITEPNLFASYGGTSLHEQSHGESFMALILNRFRGKGLYILDEPEAALSPNRQLALLSRIHELVNDHSQFIIATHSPILMAYPDATIYSIESSYEEVNLEDTEHFQVTKNFLNNPQRMMKILFED